MQKFIKENFALLLAFILPIALILLVAAGTYLPSLFLSTDYNFIYATCSDGRRYYEYGCKNYLESRYILRDNRLLINSIPPTQDSDNDNVADVDENYSVHFFLHNTEKNESREITLEEAQQLKLSELLTSPDGVTVSSGSTAGVDFLFFDTGSSYGYYLTKGNIKSKINLINNDRSYYYRDDFHFLGWILEE